MFLNASHWNEYCSRHQRVQQRNVDIGFFPLLCHSMKPFVFVQRYALPVIILRLFFSRLDAGQHIRMSTFFSAPYEESLLFLASRCKIKLQRGHSNAGDSVF